MITKTINMADVGGCDASACAYNAEKGCYARAVTIGDGVFPACDTFLGQSAHIGRGEQVAGVGACKIAGCKFNANFECQADAIVIATAGAPPACQTFAT